MGTGEGQTGSMDPSGGADPTKISEELPSGKGVCGRTGPAAAGSLSLKKGDGAGVVTMPEARRDASL